VLLSSCTVFRSKLLHGLQEQAAASGSSSSSSVQQQQRHGQREQAAASSSSNQQQQQQQEERAAAEVPPHHNLLFRALGFAADDQRDARDALDDVQVSMRAYKSAKVCGDIVVLVDRSREQKQHQQQQEQEQQEQEQQQQQQSCGDSCERSDLAYTYSCLLLVLLETQLLLQDSIGPAVMLLLQVLLDACRSLMRLSDAVLVRHPDQAAALLQLLLHFWPPSMQRLQKGFNSSDENVAVFFRSAWSSYAIMLMRLEFMGKCHVCCCCCCCCCCVFVS
jgi:hypothetical protein